MALNLSRIVTLMGSLLALAGCSGPQLLNLTIPRSGYSVHRDIDYGGHPRQKLDIYVPNRLDPSGTVIVFFYGGAWKMGSKDIYRFVGQAFATKGYITVIPDYRLYPEVTYPAFLHDAAKAVAWTRANIGRHGGNPSSLFLAGHSAGAYNAVMLALDERYLKAAGGRPDWIRGVMGLAGPYDFLPMTDPDVVAVFADKAQQEVTQPIHYAGPGKPPLWLATGDKDREVYPKNSINLGNALEKAGSPVTVRTYPGLAHIGIVLALAHGFRGKAPVLEEMDAFIRSVAPR